MTKKESDKKYREANKDKIRDYKKKKRGLKQEKQPRDLKIIIN